MPGCFGEILLNKQQKINFKYMCINQKVPIFIRTFVSA